MKHHAPAPLHSRKVVVLDIGQAGSSTGPGTSQYAASQNTLVDSQASSHSALLLASTLVAQPATCPKTYQQFFSQLGKPLRFIGWAVSTSTRPSDDDSFKPVSYIPPRSVVDAITVSEPLPSVDDRGTQTALFLLCDTLMIPPLFLPSAVPALRPPSFLPLWLPLLNPATRS
ncbi:unnamed protein product [Peniophora sp. CBMAI 1063]|nr:unnamed protein product [Peniophora sp. CBMAI 1063]